MGALPVASVRDELLAAVDVVGRAGERGVRHEVDGERGDVGRSDDASDRQRRAELLARASSSSPRSVADRGVSTNPAAIRFTRIGAISSARFLISAGIAAVSAEISANPGAVLRPPVPLMKSRVPPGRTVARRVPGDLDRQEEMGFDVAAGRVEVEVRQRRVVGTGPRDEHVVDRRGQLVEERPEPVEVRGVEGRDAPRVDLGRGLLEASRSRPVRMTSAPSARASRAVSSPMPALPPITTTVWPAQLRFPVSVALTAPAISARSAFSASA